MVKEKKLAAFEKGHSNALHQGGMSFNQISEDFDWSTVL